MAKKLNYDKGDRLALEAMRQELAELQQRQEQARAAKEQADQQFDQGALQTFADGGKLTKKQQTRLSTLLLPQGPPRDATKYAFGGDLSSVMGMVGNQGQEDDGGAVGGITEMLASSLGTLFRKGGRLPKYYTGGSFANRINRGTLDQDLLGFQGDRGLLLNGQPRSQGTFAVPDFLQQGAPGNFNQATVADDLLGPTTQRSAAASPVPNELLQQGPAPTDWMFESTTHRGPSLGTANSNQYSLGQDDLNGYVDPQAGIYGEGGIDTSLQETNAATPAGDVIDPEGDPYQERVPWLGAASQAASALLSGKKLDADKYKIDPPRIQAQKISLERERESLRRDRDIAMGTVRRGAAQGGSQSQLMQNLIAGSTGVQRNLGRGLSQSYQTEEGTNAQLAQRAALANQGVDFQSRIQNARMNQYADQYNNRIRDNRIQGTFGAGQQYLKDRTAAAQRNAMYQIMTPKNQRLNQVNDSRFKQRMGFSADPVMDFYDTGDTAPNLNYGNMFENGMGNPNFQQYLQWLQQNQEQPTE